MELADARLETAVKKLELAPNNGDMTEYSDYLERYSDDVSRMVQVCDRAGFEISRQDACKAWKAYSEISGAGWLMSDNDEEISSSIRWQCNVVEPEVESPGWRP